jgi:hypothetical protein
MLVSRLLSLIDKTAPVVGERPEERTRAGPEMSWAFIVA